MVALDLFAIVAHFELVVWWLTTPSHLVTGMVFHTDLRKRPYSVRHWFFVITWHAPWVVNFLAFWWAVLRLTNRMWPTLLG